MGVTLPDGGRFTHGDGMRHSPSKGVKLSGVEALGNVLQTVLIPFIKSPLPNTNTHIRTTQSLK